MVVCPPGCSETKVRKTRSDKGVKRGPRKKPPPKPPTLIKPKGVKTANILNINGPRPRPKRAPPKPPTLKKPKGVKTANILNINGPRPKQKRPVLIEPTYKVLAPLGPRKRPTLAEKTDNLQKNRVRAKIRRIFKGRAPATLLAYIKSVDNYTLEDLRAALAPGSRKFAIY